MLLVVWLGRMRGRLKKKKAFVLFTFIAPPDHQAVEIRLHLAARLDAKEH